MLLNTTIYLFNYFRNKDLLNVLDRLMLILQLHMQLMETLLVIQLQMVMCDEKVMRQKKTSTFEPYIVCFLTVRNREKEGKSMKTSKTMLLHII